MTAGDVGVVVLGEPIPQGSLRAVARGRVVSDNDRLQPWRDSVAWAVRSATRKVYSNSGMPPQLLLTFGQLAPVVGDVA